MEMVSYYTEAMSVTLAKKLLEFGYPVHKYGIGLYDGKPHFDIPGPDEPGWAEGSRYRIPTFGEVIDWFANKKKILIVLEPFFTYSLRDNIAYTWKIYYVDPDFGLALRTEENDWTEKGYKGGYGGSFKLTATAAIESAMSIKGNV